MRQQEKVAVAAVEGKKMCFNSVASNIMSSRRWGTRWWRWFGLFTLGN